MKNETAVWDVLVPEAEKYCAERQELTLIVGVTHRGQRSFRAFRSPDAKYSPLPNEKTIYEIGSVSKVFTTALLSVLVSRGVLSLDDTIGMYFPELEIKPEIAEITVFDLATHTSGLDGGGKVLSGLVNEAVESGDFANYTYYQRYNKENLHEELRVAELVRPRRSGWEYSRHGLSFLGHILELAAAESYEPLLKKHVCEPIGLQDTTYALSAEQEGRFIHGYNEDGQSSLVWYWGIMLPQGGIRSTMVDLLTFAEANLLDDGSQLSKDLRLARHTYFEWPEGYALPQAPETSPPRFKQALGWRSADGPGGTIWSHQGATFSYQAALNICEETQTGMAVLTSSAQNLRDVFAFPVATTQWMHQAEEALARSTTKGAVHA